MRAKAKYAIADITIDFKEGTDIYWARQQVSERLTAVSGDFPETVSGGLAPISTALSEVFMFTIESDDLSLEERRSLPLVAGYGHSPSRPTKRPWPWLGSVWTTSAPRSKTITAMTALAACPKAKKPWSCAPLVQLKTRRTLAHWLFAKPMGKSSACATSRPSSSAVSPRRNRRSR